MSGMQIDDIECYYPRKKQRLGRNDMLHELNGLINEMNYKSLQCSYVDPLNFTVKTTTNENNKPLIIPIIPTFKNKRINNLRIGLPLTDENDRANFMAPDYDLREYNIENAQVKIINLFFIMYLVKLR